MRRVFSKCCKYFPYQKLTKSRKLSTYFNYNTKKIVKTDQIPKNRKEKKKRTRLKRILLLLQIASAQKKQHSTEKCVCKQYHYDTSFFPCQILTTGPLWRSKTCHYLFFMGAGLFPWIIHSSTKLQGATPALAKLFPHSARSTEVQDSYSVIPSKVYYSLKFYRSKVHLSLFSL